MQLNSIKEEADKIYEQAKTYFSDALNNGLQKAKKYLV